MVETLEQRSNGKLQITNGRKSWLGLITSRFGLFQRNNGHIEHTNNVTPLQSAKDRIDQYLEKNPLTSEDRVAVSETYPATIAERRECARLDVDLQGFAAELSPEELHHKAEIRYIAQKMAQTK